MKRQGLTYTMTPDIDFARPQPDYSHAVPWAGWIMLAVTLAFAFGMVGDYASQLARREQIESRLRQERGRLSAERPVSTQAVAEMRFAGDALAHGRTPWESLFRDVEESAVPGIVLAGLHPQGAKREIRIGGEASSIEALSAYMDRLARRPGLAEVRLLGHEPPTRESGKHIRFELLAHWRGE